MSGVGERASGGAGERESGDAAERVSGGAGERESGDAAEQASGGAGERASGSAPTNAERPTTVLYRCPTPTNWLCPCGAVERRLRKLGVEHSTVRLPYKRSARPEIEELTRQHRLPVLVDGDEVIHDSKRILQYLDWKHRGPLSAEAAR